MRLPRLRFTIGQFMIVISVVGILLGIAAWASWDPGLIIAVAVIALVVLGPIGLQLDAIFSRDTP
jgi:hypothetical protein